MTTARERVPTDWPSGRGQAVAIIGTPAARLATTLGLELHSGIDDLDHYGFVSVTIADVGQVWLFDYPRGPVAGSEVLVDSAVAESVPGDRLVELILAALGIEETDVTWRAS